MSSLGQEAMLLLDRAATFSEPGPGVTRVLGSAEHQALLVEMRRWFADAGAEVSLDGAGNLVGRWVGSNPNERTLIIGSHQDTVRQGGRYDGIMGVLLPLVVLQRRHAEGRPLPYPVELVAFSDEEGTRFSSTLVGSAALAGTFDSALLQATDVEGVTMAQALRDLGADPASIPAAARDPQQVSGFLELHIEQGPLLEAENLPVGIVTAITGIERHDLRIIGKAGHAGTTPMHLRRDALVGASDVVQLLDQLCRDTEELVGVVGQLKVIPNAVNVIPGAVEMSLELRSPQTSIRRQARDTLLQQIGVALQVRNLDWEHRLNYEQTEVSCSPRIQSTLAAAIEDQGLETRYLFSGAGHDGLAMESLTDIGMLFMRCTDGLSHHPDEAVTVDDLEVTAQTLDRFLERWTEAAQ
ncbi:MAG: M20 family metallo-hydrolase [Natronospirillum sp.]|uniref:M20 family metallo-hydrolase n=1 Tax=Natronospirillum sp. TaxID=2812955 RepID=UPI0025F2E299|nr:M20 family metallo-hydrolase [Natronospirillum sp.]MCH8552463.1 M20 family metallo-hydrolase [Natronospirillum sp.]